MCDYECVFERERERERERPDQARFWMTYGLKVNQFSCMYIYIYVCACNEQKKNAVIRNLISRN